MAPNSEELRTCSNVGAEPDCRPAVASVDENALRVEIYTVALAGLLRHEGCLLDPQETVDHAMVFAELSVRALVTGGVA